MTPLATDTPASPDISIVVPFFDESGNVIEVLNEIRRHNPSAEIIAVDDGSNDDTWEKIRSVSGIRGLRLSDNRGQSAAIFAGLQAARAPLCITIDGDGQNDPADIPALVERSRQGDTDIVCGYRSARRDSPSRRLASRFANRIRRCFLRDGIRDTGCSLKVFPRSAVEHLVPFNGLHRYLPAFFLSAGLRITELPVNHRPRTAGTTKYTNWERGLRGAYDLVGVAWLLRRRIHFPPVEDTND